MDAIPMRRVSRLLQVALRALQARSLVGSPIPVLLLSLFVAACRDHDLPAAPPSPSIVTGPIAQSVVHSGEQPFASISASVPSFSGYFIEGGALVGLVSQPADAGAAAEALASFRSNSGDPDLASKAIVIRQARYSFHELSVWRDLVFDQVFLRFDEVVTLDSRRERELGGHRHHGGGGQRADQSGPG